MLAHWPSLRKAFTQEGKPPPAGGIWKSTLSTQGEDEQSLIHTAELEGNAQVYPGRRRPGSLLKCTGLGAGPVC